MTLERYNLKKNVWFALGEFVINIGLVFVSYRLIILRGGLEAVGLWSTLFAWTSLIRIGDVGMSNATMRFVALHSHEADGSAMRRYIEVGIVANALFFGLLSVAGYFAMAPFVGQIVGEKHAAEGLAVLPIMFAGFFLFNMAGVVLGALLGLHLGYQRSMLSILGTVVQLIAVVLLLPTLGLVGMALAQVLQNTTTIAIGWLLVRRRAEIRNILPFGFDRATFSEMLRFSLASQVANVANGLFEPVSKILIGYFGGLQLQGVYELAYRTVVTPRNAVIGAVSATLPGLTASLVAAPESASRLYKTSSSRTWQAVGLLLALVALASPVVSILWLGHVDWTYVVFVLLLGIGLWGNSLGAAAFNLAIAAGRMRNNVYVSLALLVALVVIGPISGAVLPAAFLVALFAALMGIGGLLIRFLNESMLRDHVK